MPILLNHAVLAGTPASSTQATDKNYVDTGLALKAPLASPTFTGSVTAVVLVRTPQTLSVTSSLSIDASLGDSWQVTATGSPTFNVPTNGVNGQMLFVEVLASGGARTVTMSGSIVLTTGLTAATSIASGKVGLFTLRYSTLAGSVWMFTGYTATQ